MNIIERIAKENPIKYFFSIFSLKKTHAEMLDNTIMPILFIGKINVLSTPGRSNALIKKYTEQ
jgi:hypothetical protein